jgi:hypothetical protein
MYPDALLSMELEEKGEVNSDAQISDLSHVNRSPIFYY